MQRQYRCDREMAVKHRWTQTSLILVNLVMTHNDSRTLALIIIIIDITITIVTITISIVTIIMITKVNEYPWMVGLYTRTGSLPSCGRSLINSK